MIEQVFPNTIETSGSSNACEVKIPGYTLQQNKEAAQVLLEELKGGSTLEEVLFMKESMIEEVMVQRAGEEAEQGAEEDAA